MAQQSVTADATENLLHNDEQSGKFSRQLYMDTKEELQSVTNDVMQYIQGYLASIPQLKVFEKTDETQQEKAIRNFAITREGQSLEKILQVFNEFVVHSGIQTASGGHMSYIHRYLY